MTIRTQLTKSISRGFTLVELLVSLAIILLMIIAASGIEVRYLRMASQVKHELEAQDLAEQCMNNIRKTRDTNILNTVVTFDGISNTYSCVSSPVNGVQYTTTVKVEDL